MIKFCEWLVLVLRTAFKMKKRDKQLVEAFDLLDTKATIEMVKDAEKMEKDKFKANDALKLVIDIKKKVFEDAKKYIPVCIDHINERIVYNSSNGDTRLTIDPLNRFPIYLSGELETVAEYVREVVSDDFKSRGFRVERKDWRLEIQWKSQDADERAGEILR